MALLRVTAHLNRVTGISADAVLNTFWFDDGITGSGLSVNDAVYLVDRFYNGTQGLGHPSALTYYLGDQVSRAPLANYVSIATISQPTGFQVGRTEYGEWTLRLHAEGAAWKGSLPSEMCAVTSFHGNRVQEQGPGGTRPMSRARGRVYIGPLGINALAQDSATGEVSFVSGLRTNLALACETLMSDAASKGATWVVYSRTARSVTPITGGWANNEPDVQRRRGIVETARTGWGSALT